MNKNLFAFLIFILCAACGGNTIMGLPNPMAGDKSGFLPEKNFYPGLEPLGKKRRMLFTSDEKEKYLGTERKELFEQYGMRSGYIRDYNLNGPEGALTIESYQIDSDIGPAGIYYYFFGKKLLGKGKEVDVGTQGVLDTKNNERNLYFYKGRWFFSLIYSGKEPIPDLIPLARKIAGQIPGSNQKPDGFKFLEVDGITYKHARVTWGNALNMDIFRPGAYAYAPAGGPDAQIFVIGYANARQAEDAALDYQRYLQLQAKDYERYSEIISKTRYSFRHAKEKDDGMLVYTFHRRYLIIATHLESYEKGNVLIRSVLEKMRAMQMEK